MFFLHDAFSFPADLSAALESALFHGRMPSAKLGPALRSLWPKLARGRGQAVAGEQHYSFRREEAEAYAAYYLPANCLKAALVLEESWLLGADPVPGGEARWLDLGTGPGTAFWGVAWWCANRGKKLRFTGWDQSPQFTAIARDLASSSPYRAPSEFLYAPAPGTGKAGEDPLSLLRRLKPTHVSFVNSLAEIHPDTEARAREISRILHTLAELEKKDGQPRFLLLVEPGSRESSRELAMLKDQLRAEGRVLLPCLDDRRCGALADPKDWCHEEAACEFPGWLNALGAEAGLRKEALLFSYAWIRAGAGEEAWPLAGCSRIVSQRLERKGQVECRVCTREGKRAARVQRSKADAASEFLFAAGRGDLWRNAELAEKGDVARAEVLRSERESLFRYSNS